MACNTDTKYFTYRIVASSKGQLISKAYYQAMNPSKKRMKEFIFTTMRRVFVRFLEEIIFNKNKFRNQLTFTK